MGSLNATRIKWFFLGFASCIVSLIFIISAIAIQNEITIAYLKQTGWQWCHDAFTHFEDCTQWDGALSANDVVVPFTQTSKDSPMYIKVRIGESLIDCFFDTGCSTVLIDPDLVRRHAGQWGNPLTLADDAPKFAQQAVTIPQIDIDKLKTHKLHAFVAPLRKTWGCDLIIGPSVFGRCAITIDYQTRRIIFRNPAKAAKDKGTTIYCQAGDSIPNLIGPSLKVPGKVAGQTHMLWLDTGGDTTVIYSRNTEAFPKGKPPAKFRFNTVTGQLNCTGFSTLTDITFGDTTFNDIPVLITSTPVQYASRCLDNDFKAVLGRSFLAKAKVTIDYRNMLVRLTKY